MICTIKGVKSVSVRVDVTGKFRSSTEPAAVENLTQAGSVFKQFTENSLKNVIVRPF